MKMDTKTVNHWGWFSCQLGVGEKDCEDEIMEEMLTDLEGGKKHTTANTKIQRKPKQLNRERNNYIFEGNFLASKTCPKMVDKR